MMNRTMNMMMLERGSKKVGFACPVFKDDPSSIEELISKVKALIGIEKYQGLAGSRHSYRMTTFLMY